MGCLLWWDVRTNEPRPRKQDKPGIEIGPYAVEALTSLLGMTPAPAWAEAEARLEKAREDGVIKQWVFRSASRQLQTCETWDYAVRDCDRNDTDFCYPDRATAATQAADYADKLRKPALPDVDSMSMSDRMEEMTERGWECMTDCAQVLFWRKPCRQNIYQANDETPRQFGIRALTYARRLDAAAE